MRKSELILLLTHRFPALTQADVGAAVSEILSAIGESLSSNRRVEIRGFGTFGLNYRPPRVGRNPKTSAKVAVPASYVPHFKAGKQLRERIANAGARGVPNFSSTGRQIA